MKRPALGKGLSALIPPPPDGGGLDEIPIERIIPNRYQPRQTFDPNALAELTGSIRKQGVVQPVVVRPLPDGRFELIVGERRWRAAKAAGLALLPARVIEASEQELLELALVENLQREDLNPLEIAAACRRLAEEFSLAQEEIAGRLGMHRTSVSNHLRLFDLPEEVTREIASGRIVLGHAKALLVLTRKEEQIRLCREIVKRGLSVREAERLVRRDSRAKSVLSRSPDIAALEERLARALGTKVRLRPRRRGGEIRIIYFSLDDLDRLIQRFNA